MSDDTPTIGTTMAKRKRRAPKKEAENMTVASLRAKADKVEKLARKMQTIADKMEKLDVSQMRVLVGNYEQSLVVLNRFIGRQLLARLAGKAAEMDADIDIVLGE